MVFPILWIKKKRGFGGQNEQQNSTRKYVREEKKKRIEFFFCRAAVIWQEDGPVCERRRLKSNETKFQNEKRFFLWEEGGPPGMSVDESQVDRRQESDGNIIISHQFFFRFHQITVAYSVGVAWNGRWTLKNGRKNGRKNGKKMGKKMEEKIEKKLKKMGKNGRKNGKKWEKNSHLDSFSWKLFWNT